MKYAVFLHVFNAISVNVYVFLEHFLNNFRNFSYTNSTQYQEISCNNAIHVHGNDKYVTVISQARVGYHCYYTRPRPRASGRVLITMISYECL